MTPLDYAPATPLPSRSSGSPAWISLILAIAAVPATLGMDKLLLALPIAISDPKRSAIVTVTLAFFAIVGFAFAVYALARKTFAFVAAALGLCISFSIILLLAATVIF